jgi:hypothetical protein
VSRHAWAWALALCAVVIGLVLGALVSLDPGPPPDRHPTSEPGPAIETPRAIAS